MATNLEDSLRALVRSEVRQAVADTLADVDLSAPASEPEEGWRSRLWSVDGATRLTLSEAAEALGVSERTVRRYTAGETDHPALPSRRGPTGLAIRAEDLREWVTDCEQAERFRRRAAGGQA